MSAIPKHTCRETGRATCAPCMEIEVALWDAINRYAISVGGDPSSHVYGNTPRMQAVADVGAIVARVASRQQIDDLVIDDLVKGGNGAAAAACAASAELKKLKADLQGKTKALVEEIARVLGGASS